MKYCSECGNELIEKQCDHDGMVPYCPKCEEFRFEPFNSAISTVLFNANKDKILMIQQYGRPSNILVAGYINKGENANEALAREVKEEVDLNVVDFMYNDNVYFEKSNTLIHNFISYVDSETFHLTDEVDHANWFVIRDAWLQVKENSLAKQFMFKALLKLNFAEHMFVIEEEGVYLYDHLNQRLAEVTFPRQNGVHMINHTFVDLQLRGLGIAAKLLNAAYTQIKKNKQPAMATCSYAIKYFETHPEQQDILKGNA